MPVSIGRLAVPALFVLLMLAPCIARAQQQLGHKILGGIGINAGVQSEPGLYILDRFAWFSSGEVMDRNGHPLPIVGLDIDARANVLGFGLTVKPKRAPYIGIAAGFPIASVSLNSQLPETSIDRQGFGDLFVQPLKLGLRRSHYVAVAAYTFYAPTGKFEPRRGVGVGRGFWTHQFSLGGAMFPLQDKRLRASALASYDLNTRKRGIDIKRGNTMQVQGGAGVALSRAV